MPLNIAFFCLIFAHQAACACEYIDVENIHQYNKIYDIEYSGDGNFLVLVQLEGEGAILACGNDNLSIPRIIGRFPLNAGDYHLLDGSDINHQVIIWWPDSGLRKMIFPSYDTSSASIADISGDNFIHPIRLIDGLSVFSCRYIPVLIPPFSKQQYGFYDTTKNIFTPMPSADSKYWNFLSVYSIPFLVEEECCILIAESNKPLFGETKYRFRVLSIDGLKTRSTIELGAMYPAAFNVFGNKIVSRLLQKSDGNGFLCSFELIVCGSSLSINASEKYRQVLDMHLYKFIYFKGRRIFILDRTNDLFWVSYNSLVTFGEIKDDELNYVCNASRFTISQDGLFVAVWNDNNDIQIYSIAE